MYLETSFAQHETDAKLKELPASRCSHSGLECSSESREGIAVSRNNN